MERRPIDADALRAAVGARWPRIDVVAEAESTNADLMRDTAAPDRSVLVAEHQVSGRGRLDRRWESPARAGLTFSVVLRPTAPIPTWGWLPLLTGVALHDAVRAVTSLDLALKWPNDLLCGPSEEKVSGILAQTSGEAVVVGIGLNVSTTRDELPVPTATSLELCGATAVDRTSLLAAILTQLDARVAQWTDVRGDAEACGLAADYRAACATLDRQVSVTTTSGRAVTGDARGIDSDGRLQVDVGGRVEVIGAGDVEHLRPAP
jgi:BirA family transcriptional regulator, biotin operon repressor / biotin---[acetyl-CoA-carboxylase] ligase